ncbi:hypothetical protein [Bacillus sp. CECT 9360]|uniref:hypothetical protein n=1 Tax=Bacillus sp. CECT 9360 TaxID=2845821 RepID=UPI001E3B8E08|nr:hypothetical protein [Bacillus sp. CECT 9360]CAH0345208.1 hypothetical protein BCI9360_01487 [Bacillus sp. CECT 9360]
MSRGKHFNSRKKGHPGDFPQNSTSPKKAHIGEHEEPDMVALEAFKNRIKE